MKSIFPITKRRLLACFFWLPLAACVPIQTTYFEPAGANVAATKGMCNGRYGAPANASISLGGAKILLTLNRYPIMESKSAVPDTSIFLGLFTIIESGHWIAFDPDKVRVQTAQGDVVPRLSEPLGVFAATGLSSLEWSRIRPQKILGHTKFNDQGKRFVSIKMEYAFDNDAEFTVYPGEIEIDGSSYSLPVITFRKKTHTEMLILNC